MTTTGTNAPETKGGAADVFSCGDTPSLGVVTAADERYFLDAQLLLRSLEAERAPRVAIFDLGLQRAQRDWLLDRPRVACLSLPEHDAEIAAIKTLDKWRLWLKPAFLRHAPFERVLWLDADTVAVAALAEAFSLLEEGPLLVGDRYGAATQNDPALYDFLPLPHGAVSAGWGLNSGVVGVRKDRDAGLLDRWWHAVQWARSNANRRHLLRWCDQGALVWAVHNLGIPHAVRQDLAWNFPATCAADLIASAKARQRTLWDELRARFPRANVLHWYGAPRLSQLLRDEIGDELAAILWNHGKLG